MTGTARQLLAALDALTDAEKHEAAVQVLRRVVEGESGDISEEDLIPGTRRADQRQSSQSSQSSGSVEAVRNASHLE